MAVGTDASSERRKVMRFDVMAREFVRMERKEAHKDSALAEALYREFGYIAGKPDGSGRVLCGEPRYLIRSIIARDPRLPKRWKPYFDREPDYDSLLPEVFTSSTGRFVLRYNKSQQSPHCVKDPAFLGPKGISQIGDPLAAEIGRTDPLKGAPSYVQEAAFWLDHALDDYLAAGVPDPTTRYKPVRVKLWDDGASWGFALGDNRIFLHPRLDDRKMQIVPAHELFHLVQDLFVFIDDGGSPLQVITLKPGYLLWSEGLAAAMPDMGNDFINDWMMYWGSLLPYSTTGLQDMSYQGCIFWKYVCDRFTGKRESRYEPYVGGDIVRELLDMVVPGMTLDFGALVRHLESKMPPGARFGELLTSTPSPAPPDPPPSIHQYQTHPPDRVWYETLYGDWLVANVCQDQAIAGRDKRYAYVERNDPPGLSPAICARATPSTFPAGLTVNPWSNRYYAVEAGSLAGPLRIEIDAETVAGLPQARALMQLVLTDGTDVVDIIRSQGPRLDRIVGRPYGVGADARNIGRIYILFGSREEIVVYKPRLSVVQPAPDLMLTPWNCEPGREYELESGGPAGDNKSPDVWLEVEGVPKDLFISAKTPSPADIKVRVRNRGNRDSGPVTVKLFVQYGGGDLRTDRWLPGFLKCPSLAPVTIAGVPANGEALASFHLEPVPGYPPIEGHPLPVRKVRVKALLEAPDDSSADNNAALTTMWEAS